MAFYDDEELAQLRIIRSIFHIVGPLRESLKLLGEFNVGQMEDFFLGRIKSVNGGNRYRFLPDSPVRTQLSRIRDDLGTFQVESENLASAYNGKHGGSSNGAYIVFVLQSPLGVSFALLKFDDERVLSYSYDDGLDGRPVPRFGEFQQTFVQNREALQKAVLIRLETDDDDAEVCVVDRQNPSKPARYFEDYLLVRRERDEINITETAKKVAIAVFKRHKDLFSDDVKTNFQIRLFESSQGGAEIRGEQPELWFQTIVGDLTDKPEVLKTLNSELKKNRLDGESFRLSPNVLPRPTVRKIETNRGIKLIVPQDANDVIEIDKDNGRITIRDNFTIAVEA